MDSKYRIIHQEGHIAFWRNADEPILVKSMTFDDHDILAEVLQLKERYPINSSLIEMLVDNTPGTINVRLQSRYGQAPIVETSGSSWSFTNGEQAERFMARLRTAEEFAAMFEILRQEIVVGTS